VSAARRVIADRSICIGSGNCVRMVEEMFDQDDDGRVVVKADADPGAAGELVDLAVDSCPVGALSFAD
jgi:ferredoxin